MRELPVIQAEDTWQATVPRIEDYDVLVFELA
jgi:hypothetical protein